MEQINSNSEKKIQQIDIFKRYAKALSTSDRALDEKDQGYGELVLNYDDFIKLISNSRKLYSKFTDHSYNLNQVPVNTFGCIFLAIDENNKGYLTISDWFYFNNILEHENFHIILLYEFFRKFDVASLKQSSRQAIEDSAGVEKRIKPINYGNKFLSFDELVLNSNQFKSTINLLHECVDDDYVRKHGLLLNWNDFNFLKLYECFPYLGKGSDDYGNTPYLTLNSLITILQTDLKNQRMFNGFSKLCHKDPIHNNLVLNKEKLVYLLKLFYSHKVSADIFDSLNLSNTSLLKSKNDSISYNVFKDIFYLFQNFDLLNQALLKYAEYNDLAEDDLRDYVITKRDFMKILNAQYNKVNNVNEFSPSQINLLFSIVANSKENNMQNKKLKNELKHQDRAIDNVIQNNYVQGGNNSRKSLESFGENYLSLLENFTQDTSFKKIFKASGGLFDHIFYGKKDVATMGSNLTIQDFLKILNPNYLNDVVHKLEMQHLQDESLYINYYFYPIFDSLFNFILGSAAGCIGATVVYPIDFIKTRMQVQRSLSKYKNSLDCLIKVVKTEGVRGLYSGLGFQLIGVAPEKAIKLTVNDFLRKKLIDKQGNLHAFAEVLSGASAGTCQVIFTNPIEIVKIRLQVKSESVANASLTASQIIKSLGIKGLYKGVTACLMRDVPFSAIYFPTYAHLKKDIFNFDPKDKTKRNRLKTWELLVAGALAGMPAAFLTTPFDVIKTRLQVDPRKGETRYKGIFHAAKTILKEESIRSFFKGGGARVLRSSPQFGFTLAAYELFKNAFPSLTVEEVNPKQGGANNSPDNANALASFSMSYFSDIFSRLGEGSPSSHKGHHELFNPIFDPYGSNFLNYYYKSCQVAKTFIDLDNSFSKFDHSVYKKFLEILQDPDNKS
ncbi:citrin KNAG_0D02230 [Huiozyma naganishii CBS 8797]|uniref:Mitochondrial aspartate-glutamate transporter AGC1 n=1 Tax=Huiozyma naganishii (strain ATCC MYA-139 / BCRC 22969 / CBS 8797 / KCTC 17520 / NBRC 10181 / NCYC 3082 / Yp74L-3) TaxID=1071383 RepID=J7RKG7_HUIN7|nr:hypothetical protein KNAG_0D02230 [Kazachstania naganishii CBS 8797]CCK69973.1 hypothetical protein KNAG_0D02230 [Kazachstania naganishii CBS 8797]